jgi:hypothetical protein
LLTYLFTFRDPTVNIDYENIVIVNWAFRELDILGTNCECR